VASIAKKQSLTDEIEALTGKIATATARRESLGESRSKRRRIQDDSVDMGVDGTDTGTDTGIDKDDSYLEDDYDSEDMDLDMDLEEESVPLGELQRQLQVATQTLDVVSTTLTVAIETSQTVFNISISNCLQLINHRCQILLQTEDNQLDSIFVTLCSLIKSILRIYEYHQINIISNNMLIGNQHISLCNRLEINNNTSLFHNKVISDIWNRFA